MLAALGKEAGVCPLRFNGGGLENKVSLLAHEGIDVVGGLCVAGGGRF